MGYEKRHFSQSTSLLFSSAYMFLIIKENGNYIVCDLKGKYEDDNFVNEVLKLYLESKNEKY